MKHIKRNQNCYELELVFSPDSLWGLRSINIYNFKSKKFCTPYGELMNANLILQVLFSLRFSTPFLLNAKQKGSAEPHHKVVSSAQCEKDTELIYFFLLSGAFLRMAIDGPTASWFLLVAVSAFLNVPLPWPYLAELWCLLLTDSKPLVS